jgi:hypothetical protein
VASFVTGNDCPVNVVTTASQGSFMESKDLKDQDVESIFFLRFLMNANVGYAGKGKGVMIPFCQYPMKDTIPQIVSVPNLDSADKKSWTPPPLDNSTFKYDGYFVAYSCMPACLEAMITQIRKNRVILFTKNTEQWKQYYSKYSHVTVVPRSPEFAQALENSNGLLCQPSRGVVTQAVACGKPIYLFCPKGHIEQKLNYTRYLEEYEGVESPSTMPISRWEDRKWELRPQALKMREWLGRTDEKILSTLLPRMSYKPIQAPMDHSKIA